MRMATTTGRTIVPYQRGAGEMIDVQRIHFQLQVDTIGMLSTMKIIIIHILKLIINSQLVQMFTFLDV